MTTSVTAILTSQIGAARTSVCQASPPHSASAPKTVVSTSTITVPDYAATHRPDGRRHGRVSGPEMRLQMRLRGHPEAVQLGGSSAFCLVSVAEDRRFE